MTRPYAQFEEFIAGLARTLLQLPGALTVAGGLRNGIKGISGTRHQIDVSFEDARGTPPKLVLIECKYLNWPVKLAHVKVLKATVDDTAANVGNSMQVKGMLVSRKGAQSGARSYASYYSIDIQQIESQREYDFAYERWRVSGRSGAASGTSQASAEGVALRTCSACGRQFRVNDKCHTCPYCGHTD